MANASLSFDHVHLVAKDPHATAAWYVEKIEDLAAALAGARASQGPAVVCIRTDRDANLLIPQEMFGRFFEVYQGPAA